MTYLLTTSRKATAVLGSVFGNFDGSAEYHHLILNCVTRLEVWELSVADLARHERNYGSVLSPYGSNNNSATANEQSHFTSGGGSSSSSASACPPPPPMRLAAEFPINGTIKHMLAVPIPVARTAKSPRLCLFIVTEKLDVCIIGFNRAAKKVPSIRASTAAAVSSSSATNDGTASNASDFVAELVPETLYSTNIATSLFHRHFGQSSLCVSSHPINNYGSLGGDVWEGSPNSADNNDDDDDDVIISGGSDEDSMPHTQLADDSTTTLDHTNANGTAADATSTAANGAAAVTTTISSAHILQNGEEDINPIVALSHIRSYVILFDIAACIVDGASMACTRRMLTTAGGGAGSGAHTASRKRGRNGQQQEEQASAVVAVPPPTDIRNSGLSFNTDSSAGNFNNANNNDNDTANNNVDVVSQSTATTAYAAAGNRSANNDDDDAPTTTTGISIVVTPPVAAPTTSEDITSASDEPTDTEISHQLQSSRLFSMAFISTSMLKKRLCLPFTYCPIMEAEPRSICLQRSSVYGKSLAVLHQDPRGRTHIRRYVITEQPTATNNNTTSNNNNAAASAPAPNGSSSSAAAMLMVGHTMLQQRQIPILAPIFDRTVLRLCNKSYGLVLTRGATLQNDVETDAMLLHAMPNGILVVGAILATYIDTEGKNCKGHVTTTITPNPYARSEPVVVQNISPISCVVGYINGAIIVCALEDGDRGELTCHTLAAETTPMTGLCTIGRDFFFAASAYHHSVFVHRNTGGVRTAITNTGPIVEMSVMDGFANGQGRTTNNFTAKGFGGGIGSPISAAASSTTGGGMSVVAATGVEHFTSLQVIREALQVNEEACIEGLPGVIALHSVPAIITAADIAAAQSHGMSTAQLAPVGLLALSFANETRMMLFEDGSSFSLEEADFECFEPTLCLGRVAPSAVIHVTPTGASLLHISATAVKRAGPTVQFPPNKPANMAITDPQCSTLLVVSGADVGIYELPSLQLLHTITFPNQVASIDMTAAYEVIVGLWGSNTVQMFTAEDLTPFTLVEALPMLPRSVKLSSLAKSQFMTDVAATLDRTSMTDRHLFVGFIDGSIGIIPISAEKPQSPARVIGKLQHLSLGSQPVTIQTILNTNRIPCGMLCTGDVPGVLFASSTRGVTSSGFGVRALDSAAQLTTATFASYVAGEGKLIISSLDSQICHRVNAISQPIHQTIPKLKHIPRWNNLFLAAQREAQQDSIISYYVAGGVVNRSTRVTAPFSLLESERCEFIEWLDLNGAPFTVAEGEVPLSSSSPFAGALEVANSISKTANMNSSSISAAGHSPYIASKASWDPTQPFSAVILGTNFSYPNDDIPRNGRIILVGMERANPTTNKMTMVQLCDRDIRGMVMCACMVPRTNNRILVGVTGCVQMYRWSPNDRSFVFEISASFGAAVTKLMPLSGSSLGAMKARPEPPQIVAATPAVRAAPSRPQSTTSARTLGGFSGLANSAGGPNVGGGTNSGITSPTSPNDVDEVIEDRETSSLVLCADLRNSLAVIALNPVELMRVEANERVFREVLDVVPAGNKAFVEKKTGLKVYDPHFITSDTDLNLFVISAMKDHKSPEGTSIYQLKGVVPQLSVCGQIHVGDRITVIQRGSLQATKKVKTNYNYKKVQSQHQNGNNGASNGFSSSSTTALDMASAAAATTLASNPALLMMGTSSATADQHRANASRKQSPLLPDITERFSNNGSPNPQQSGNNDASAIIAHGIRDSALPCFIYGTVHGAIGAITPLNPLAFNYLCVLQRCLAKVIKPVGGLSYDQFKKVFNRETSPYTATAPHFAENRSDLETKRSSKLKSYNFIDGDLLAQFLGPSSTSAAVLLDEASKAQAVNITNKAIRSAAFSGELFRGTEVDAKRLGVGGAVQTTNAATATAGASSATAVNATVNPAAPTAAAAATPSATNAPSFTAAQTQPPMSIPSTPLTLVPRRGGNQQQQNAAATATSVDENAQPANTANIVINGVTYDSEGNKIDAAAGPKRTTFTPAEMEHLNELLSIADLPEYPLTVETCERFLSDLQRFC